MRGEKKKFMEEKKGAGFGGPEETEKDNAEAKWRGAGKVVRR